MLRVVSCVRYYIMHYGLIQTNKCIRCIYLINLLSYKLNGAHRPIPGCIDLFFYTHSCAHGPPPAACKTHVHVYTTVGVFACAIALCFFCGVISYKCNPHTTARHRGPYVFTYVFAIIMLFFAHTNNIYTVILAQHRHLLITNLFYTTVDTVGKVPAAHRRVHRWREQRHTSEFSDRSRRKQGEL